MAKYYYHKHYSDIFLKGITLEEKIDNNEYKKMSSIQQTNNIFHLIDKKNLSVSESGVKYGGMLDKEIYLRSQDIGNWKDKRASVGIWSYYNGIYLYLTFDGGGYISPNDISIGKTNFIEIIKAEEGAYPDNGLHTDGFWYEKGDKATLPIFEIKDGKATAIAERYYVENENAIPIKARYFIENGKAIKIY